MDAGIFEATLHLTGTSPLGICLPSVGSSLIEGQGCIRESPKICLQLATSKWDSSYEELLSLTDLKPLQDI